MQTLVANTIEALGAYRAQLEEIADIASRTLAMKTELAAVRSQLAGLKSETSGLSLAQYKTLKEMDEQIFVKQRQLEELESAMPKTKSTLSAVAEANTEAKFRHDKIESNILQFRASLKGGGSDAA